MYNVLSYMDNEETSGRGATRNYSYHKHWRVHHMKIKQGDKYN
jgi:hypothetical protein